MNTTAIAHPSIRPLFSASEISNGWLNQLKPFWQKMQSGVLTSADNLQLRYYYHLVPNARNAIVISSGRMEMALKYAELCFELTQAGYSVFLLDHRGQGLSQRELSNPHKGYVANFELYQQDFAQFVHQIVLPSQHQRHIALGHSMGCAILASYLQQPHPFQAAILASPMFGIYTGLVPTGIATTITRTFSALNRAVSKTPWYFLAQGNYQEKAFRHNPLTSCQQRYQWVLQRYQEQPQSQLGGVTSAWIDAAIVAMNQIQQDAAKWHTPTLLLQAGADKVVSNHAQNAWYQQLPSAVLHQKVILAMAKHEIFIEQDHIRQKAITAINTFLAQLPSIR